MENNIEDIEALRKYLGLKRIALLGTSYGGMVALGYATRYSKNLNKLILVATAPSYRFIDEAKQYLRLHATKEQLAAAEKLWQGNFKSAREVEAFFTLMNSIYSLSARKRPAMGRQPTQTKWSHEVLNQAFKGFLREYDLLPKLKKISCPTLVLAGDQDWICSPNQAKAIAKHIPDAVLKIFKNCGHSIAVDAHTSYIRIIKRFLNLV